VLYEEEIPEVIYTHKILVPVRGLFTRKEGKMKGEMVW
jgi:hypothetical protein